MAIAVVVSMLGLTAAVTTAGPAGANCPSPVGGTWIGDWNTTSGPTFVGASQATLTFASVTGVDQWSWSGIMTFSTGSNLVFAGQTVSGTLDCTDVEGSIGSNPPVTLSGTLSPDGMQITNGHFLSTQPGVFSSAVVQSPVTTNGTALTTDSNGTGATPAAPLQVSVNAPAGPLTIGQAVVPPTTVSGYYLIGQDVEDITAPPGSVSSPITITFDVDASVVPSSGIVQVFHNGVLIPDCPTPPLQTGFDPCVSLETHLASGDVEVTVLTTSASVWAVGVIASAPTAPRGASGAPGNGRATLRWTPPSTTGGPAVSNYVVTPFIGAAAQESQIFAGSTTSATIAGLSNSSTYRFRVVAVNSVGRSPSSSPSNAVTVGAPTAPRSPSAVRGHKQATVRWTAPASANGAAITKYVVTPYRAGVAQRSLTFNATTSKIITGLTSERSYTFTIAARNSRGTGPASLPTAAVTIG